MEKAKELPPPIEPTPGNMRDVTFKTAALDKERHQVARLRQEIIDEYEEKSRELLEYLNSMEAEFEHQQREYEQRETTLRNENDVLKDQLARGSKLARRMLSAKTRKYKREAARGIELSAFDTLKDETRQYEWNYRMEHNRAEELKAYVDDLQLDLQKAEELALQRKKRMDQSKKKWELENRELRRKAALGWMLGCLSELYLKVDPKIGGASIMKLVKKVQRELETGSGALNGKDLSPKLEYEAIQGQLHQLIGSSQASRVTPLRDDAETFHTIKETPSKGTKPWNRVDEDESPRRRRKQWQKYKLNLDPVARKAEDPKITATSPSIFDNLREGQWQKESTKNSWAQIQVFDDKQSASHEYLKSEADGLLKGFEKSMNFLLSKDKRQLWSS